MRFIGAVSVYWSTVLLTVIIKKYLLRYLYLLTHASPLILIGRVTGDICGAIAELGLDSSSDTTVKHRVFRGSGHFLLVCSKLKGFISPMRVGRLNQESQRSVFAV
jgi:hypothetical protein